MRARAQWEHVETTTSVKLSLNAIEALLVLALMGVTFVASYQAKIAAATLDLPTAEQCALVDGASSRTRVLWLTLESALLCYCQGKRLAGCTSGCCTSGRMVVTA